MNAYNLTFAVLLITGAALGDRFGRRRLYAAGLGLFAVASAACALAPNVGVLIAARAVQGAGAALLTPLALALLERRVPAGEAGRRDRHLQRDHRPRGAPAARSSAARSSQGISWEWIFWINVPIGLLALPLVLTQHAREPRPRTRRLTSAASRS